MTGLISDGWIGKPKCDKYTELGGVIHMFYDNSFNYTCKYELLIRGVHGFYRTCLNYRGRGFHPL